MLPRLTNLLVLTEAKINMEMNGKVKLEMETIFLKAGWKTETPRAIEGGNSINCRRRL